MTDTSTSTAGIDTSKADLDVAIHGQAKPCQLPNTPAGWKQVAAYLAQSQVKRVGIEATGGYERGVTRYLQAAGFTVDLLQPLQVKAFAKLHLQRAKNDRIDAGLIAACTHLMGERDRMAPDPRFDPLAGHLTFIEQVEDDIVQHKTRLEHVADKRLRRIVEADIARLAKRRKAELARLEAELRVFPDLARRFGLVLSVPSIAERTALAIVVRMPELGQVSREQAAALAGLAPFVHQSGKRQGEAHIGGGRSRLRRSLYAASLAGAHRWNPALIDLYQRLRARGKPHVSAMVACARKLLIFANAVVQRGTPWQARPAMA